jgi:hypoxanthine phosphoribosyltransferase
MELRSILILQGFNCNVLPTRYVNLITIADTLPMLTNKLGFMESIGGTIRQLVILKNELQMFRTKPIAISVSLICKLLYNYERSRRIKTGNRENFGLLHNAEHIELFIYLFNNIPNNENRTKRNLLVYTIITGLIIPSLLFKSYNVYISNTYENSLPIWFDESLKEMIKTKVTNNYNSNINIHPYNYIVKIFSPYLSWDIQTWNKIEEQIHNLYKKIKKDGFEPDICVGIKTGGALCVKFLSDKFKKKSYYLKCKTWSGNTFVEDWTHAIKLTMNYENYLKDTKSCNVSELNEFPEDVKNVLLFDDTISTGKTMFATREYIQTKYPNALIKTAALIVPHDVKPTLIDYYDNVSNVPIFWPWGCELD